MTIVAVQMPARDTVIREVMFDPVYRNVPTTYSHPADADQEFASTGRRGRPLTAHVER